MVWYCLDDVVDCVVVVVVDDDDIVPPFVPFHHHPFAMVCAVTVVGSYYCVPNQTSRNGWPSG